MPILTEDFTQSPSSVISTRVDKQKLVNTGCVIFNTILRQRKKDGLLISSYSSQSNNEIVQKR